MKKAAILFAFLAGTFLCAQEVTYKEAALRVGDKTLHVQLADTPLTLEQGLMYRKTVLPYDGMIFVFSKPQQVAFWMKNTLIPLDVGYFDSKKVLREIYSMKPLDLTPILSKSRDIQYALELPAGDFVKKGLKVGDTVDYKILDTSQKVLQ